MEPSFSFMKNFSFVQAADCVPLDGNGLDTVGMPQSRVLQCLPNFKTHVQSGFRTGTLSQTALRMFLEGVVKADMPVRVAYFNCMI